MFSLSHSTPGLVELESRAGDERLFTEINKLQRHRQYLLAATNGDQAQLCVIGLIGAAAIVCVIVSIIVRLYRVSKRRHFFFLIACRNPQDTFVDSDEA